MEVFLRSMVDLMGVDAFYHQTLGLSDGEWICLMENQETEGNQGFAI